jgi:hypothetical protein
MELSVLENATHPETIKRAVEWGIWAQKETNSPTVGNVTAVAGSKM